MIWDAIGFIAYATNVLGNLLLAWKRNDGWFVRLASNISWGAYGVHLASAPILFNTTTFFVINCFGWWKWRREARASSPLAPHSPRPAPRATS